MENVKDKYYTMSDDELESLPIQIKRTICVSTAGQEVMEYNFNHPNGDAEIYVSSCLIHLPHKK